VSDQALDTTKAIPILKFGLFFNLINMAPKKKNDSTITVSLSVEDDDQVNVIQNAAK
jgi:hypothetical protein